jgi:hypothetical protein
MQGRNAGADGKFPSFLALEIGVSPVCPRFIRPGLSVALEIGVSPVCPRFIRPRFIRHLEQAAVLQSAEKHHRLLRMTKPSKNNVAKKWTTAKKFKVTGSAFLLIAFATQMYQFRASSLEAMKMGAAELDGRQHIKALGYENLYFTIKAATGQEDPANLRFAALERALGRTVMSVTSDESKNVKLARSNKIMLAARGVSDLNGFNEFMRTLQTEVDTANTSELDSLIRAGDVADSLWWIYVALYAIGSVLLLRSQYLE